MIQGTFGSLILKISQTSLSLLLSVVLARMLGVEGFGIYAFCLSVVSLLTVPAMVGGQQLLIREVAAYKVKREFHFLAGLLRRMWQASTSASIILSLSAAGVGLWVYKDSRMLVPFVLAMLLVPLTSGVNLQSSALRGLNRILLGQVHLTLLPLLVLSTIILINTIANIPLNPEIAIGCQIASSAALFILTYLLLRWCLPKELGHIAPDFETKRWVGSVLPFVLAGSMQILNKETSVVLLGVLQGTEAVGLYRVAQRGSELIPFGLLAVNMAIAPKVAELFSRGEKQRLQNLINKSIMAIMAFALPVALALIFFGMWLIPLVFGAAYAQAYIPLVILSVGQLFNAFMGSVGLVLNMTGLERITALGVTIAALSNVLLNIVLIPFWGAVGAAIASSGSLVVWNILLTFWLYRKTGILSTLNLTKRIET